MKPNYTYKRLSDRVGITSSRGFTCMLKDLIKKQTAQNELRGISPTASLSVVFDLQGWCLKRHVPRRTATRWLDQLTELGLVIRNPMRRRKDSGRFLATQLIASPLLAAFNAINEDNHQFTRPPKTVEVPSVTDYFGSPALEPTRVDISNEVDLQARAELADESRILARLTEDSPDMWEVSPEDAVSDEYPILTVV